MMMMRKILNVQQCLSRSSLLRVSSAPLANRRFAATSRSQASLLPACPHALACGRCRALSHPISSNQEREAHDDDSSEFADDSNIATATTANQVAKSFLDAKQRELQRCVASRLRAIGVQDAETPPAVELLPPITAIFADEHGVEMLQGSARAQRFFFGITADGRRCVGLRRDSHDDDNTVPSSSSMVVAAVPDCFIAPRVTRRLLHRLNAWFESNHVVFCEQEAELIRRGGSGRQQVLMTNSLQLHANGLSQSGGCVLCVDVVFSNDDNELLVLLWVTGSSRKHHALRDDVEPTESLSAAESEFVRVVCDAVPYPLVKKSLRIELCVDIVTPERASNIGGLASRAFPFRTATTESSFQLHRSVLFASACAPQGGESNVAAAAAVSTREKLQASLQPFVMDEMAVPNDDGNSEGARSRSMFVVSEPQSDLPPPPPVSVSSPRPNRAVVVSNTLSKFNFARDAVIAAVMALAGLDSTAPSATEVVVDVAAGVGFIGIALLSCVRAVVVLEDNVFRRSHADRAARKALKNNGDKSSLSSSSTTSSFVSAPLRELLNDAVQRSHFNPTKHFLHYLQRFGSVVSVTTNTPSPSLLPTVAVLRSAFVVAELASAANNNNSDSNVFRYVLPPTVSRVLLISNENTLEFTTALELFERHCGFALRRVVMVDEDPTSPTVFTAVSLLERRALRQSFSKSDDKNAARSASTTRDGKYDGEIVV